MASRTRTIEVAPESELARALRDSENDAVVLFVDGKRFRLEPEEISQDDVTEDELWADFDGSRFLEGINTAAGGWGHLDAVRMKADVRRWRDEGSRPMARP